MQKYSMLLATSALLCLGLATGCGNNDENNTNNKNNTNNTKMDMTTDDMSNDMTKMDMTEDMPKMDMEDDMNQGPNADVLETEPNDEIDQEQGVDQSNAVEVGKSFGGTIKRGSGENFDQDLWKMQLEAGTVLELNIKELGDGITDQGLSIEVFNGDGDVDIYRTMNSTNGKTRQLFIPQTGTYYLAVFDGTILQETVPTHGGATATYVIESKATALTTTDGTFPGDVTGDVNDAKIDAYKFTLTDAGLHAINIFAGREPIMSELDPAFLLWNTQTKSIVAENDDIDFDNGNYDSSVETQLEAGVEYIAIVDFFANGNNKNYQLSFAKRDDSYESPSDLTLGTPATGVIEAGNMAQDFIDSDFYKLPVAREKAIKVTVKADNADLKPSIIVVNNDTGQRVAVAKSVGDTSSLTFFHPKTGEETGDYRIVVNDERNVFNDDSYLGGATFTYTVNAEEVTLTPQAATLPLDQSVNIPIGSYVAYDLDLLANQTVSIQSNSTFPTAEVIAGVINADKELALSATDVATYTAAAAAKETFLIRDAFFLGTYMDQMYNANVQILSADVTTTTYTDAQETAGNTSVAMAQEVTNGSRVKGQTQGDPMANPASVDYYKVQLEQGDVLAAFTNPDADAPLRDPNDPSQGKEDADTIVKIVTADGMVLATNDDRISEKDSTFGALLFKAPAAGAYYIVVEPYYLASFDAFLNGYYTLDITVNRANVPN